MIIAEINKRYILHWIKECLLQLGYVNVPTESTKERQPQRARTTVYILK
jgi:hypothetical protein